MRVTCCLKTLLRVRIPVFMLKHSLLLHTNARQMASFGNVKFIHFVNPPNRGKNGKPAFSLLENEDVDSASVNKGFFRFFKRLKQHTTTASVLTLLSIADKAFTIEEFCKGCTQLFPIVSQALNNRNFDDLEALVKPDLLIRLKSAVEKIEPKYEKLLNLNESDLLYRKMEWAKLWTRGDSEFVDILQSFGAVHSDLKEMKEFKPFFEINLSGAPQDIFKAGFKQAQAVLADQKGMDRAEDAFFDNIVFAKFLFTRQIKPELDGGWVISSLNYLQP